jgi:hypothetical protein
MALVTFSADIENVAADLSTAWLVDLTNYTSQGVPRNTIALFASLWKRDATSSDTVITITPINPATDVQWQFALPTEDGEFVTVLIGVPNWVAGTYSEYQTVFYNQNVYYVSNPAGTSQTPGGSDWTLVQWANVYTTLTGLPSFPSNVSQTQIYNYSTAHVSTGVLADAMSDFGLKVVNGQCKDWNEAAGVMTGGALIDSGWTNFRKQNYVVSQQIMDFLQATTSLPI